MVVMSQQAERALTPREMSTEAIISLLFAARDNPSA